jgi:hypothetical protein
MFLKGEPMSEQPMFIITKSGLVIRPERLKDLGDYPTRYVREGCEMIATYLCAGGQEKDTVVVDMRREIARAEEAAQELAQLVQEVQRIYELNFVREALIVRETLHALGFTRLDEVYVLSVLVDHMVARFKAENPKCSEEKFRKFINNDTDDPIIITRQARRVSA